jgi:protein subunit release factor B
MMVCPKKQLKLLDWMQKLGIKEEDLLEKFILGSGSGGQKINKTSSCVYLKHLPSGLEVKCQQERSRELNRFLARRELCLRLEEIRQGILSQKKQEIAKLRKQKKKRSKRAQEKILQEKKSHSEKKLLRKTPSTEH